MAAVIGFLLVTVVSVVGWIAVQVWEMKPKVVDTETRVNRIVEVLPELKVRLVEEDLKKNIRAAILTTESIKTLSGRWIADVHWLDFVAGQRTTFRVELKGPEDPTIAYLVTGIANAHGSEKLSLAEYERVAAQIGKPLPPPTYLDQSSSYAIIKASAVKDLEDLRRVLGNPIAEERIDKKLLKIDQLVEELKVKENEYRPKEQ
jgi:hypothetical protein